LLVCKCGKKAKQVGSAWRIIVLDDIGVTMIGAMGGCKFDDVIGVIIVDGVDVD
jgi:hypothetical protein